MQNRTRLSLLGSAWIRSRRLRCRGALAAPLGAALLGLLVVCASLLAPPRPTAAQSAGEADGEAAELRERLEGRWRLAQSQEQARRVIAAAAGRAAEGFNFFVRSVARSRLRDGTPLQDWIELSFERGDRLTVRFSEGDSYTTRLGRTQARQGSDSERLRVTQRFRDGTLEQVFEGEEGTRWYVYTPTGADRLRLQVTTNSPRMPEPMRFTLPYQRR